MTLALLSSWTRAFAAAALVAAIAAGCGSPTGSVEPVTPEPTLPPTAPPYTLAPGPSGCPTSAPPPMAAGTTATVTMNTNYGPIVIKVEADLGANAAGAFLALARCGYYNNVIFHRVVADFIIQAGDGQYARLPDLTPNKMGQGGPGWTVLDDKINSDYKRGTLAIANTGCPNTGGSQFFIVLSDDNGLASAPTMTTCNRPSESASASASASAAPSPSTSQAASASPSATAAPTETPLPGTGYSIFGRVTSGLDIVDSIAGVPVGGWDVAAYMPSTPTVPVVITGITVTTP